MVGNILVSTLLRGSMYILMGMGLALVFGVMRISNFAHGDFYMIGAMIGYFAAYVLKLNPILAILVSALGGFLIGAVVQRVFFAPLRKRSKKDWLLNTFLLTGGLSFVLQNAVQLIAGADYKGMPQLFDGSLAILGMNVSMDRIYAVLISLLAVGGFWLFMRKTRVGNAIWAVSEDETGAELMGINLNFIHILTFGLSCALAAIAGAALISINPAYPSMGQNPLLKSWCVVILVGMDNTAGTIIGGLLVAFIEVLAVTFLGQQWQDAICFIVMIIVLVVKPNGIFGKPMKV